MNSRLELKIVSERLGIYSDVISGWVELGFIRPCDPENILFDDEDIERMRLIQNLQELYAANDESLGAILHLLDQVYLLQDEIKRLRGDLEKNL